MPSKPYYSLLQSYAPWNLRWTPSDLPTSEAQGLLACGLQPLFFPSLSSISQSTNKTGLSCGTRSLSDELCRKVKGRD